MSQKNSQLNNERRKDPRVNVQIWAIEKNKNSSSFHLVSNLSMGGLFLEKKLPFTSGAIVKLELELEGEIIELHGKTVDNYLNPKTNRSGAGVQFIDMDKKVKARIEEYLKNPEEINS